uniref:Uncharacterized protein n=1 Tax=Anguilla anguilla TaxID=7936 RepID=A0A0E9UY07_ANGAN
MNRNRLVNGSKGRSAACVRGWGPVRSLEPGSDLSGSGVLVLAVARHTGAPA